MIIMWRKKKYFNEFLSIVKDMPSLHAGRTHRGYRRWNHRTRSYDGPAYEPLNVETLMNYVNTLEDSYKTSYQVNAEGYNYDTIPTLEEYKITCLTQWIRTRNYNATKEFRETRKTTEYFKRLENYEKR